MPLPRLLLTALIVGVVVNVYDFVLHNILLTGPVYSHIPILHTAVSVPLLVLGDFVAALVFVWVYQRVRASFGPGAAGGAAFGLYAGILVNFPTWIFCYLLIEGFTYGLAWVWTLAGIGWGVLAGAVTGALASRPVPLAAAAKA
jgi:hypothetical protein